MSSTYTPAPLVREPKNAPKGTIIMLHGRGSSSYNFQFELMLTTTSDNKTFHKLLPDYKWVFPGCPDRFAATFQETYPQWYDIASLTSPEQESDSQVAAIKESLEHLKDVVEREAASSPTGNVIIGGISQGFSIVVLALLLGFPHIRAAIGFSSWLPFESEIRAAADSAAADKNRSLITRYMNKRLATEMGSERASTLPPVFLGHCADDHLVDVELGRSMKNLLGDLGYDVTWAESPNGGHWINEPAGMDGVQAFLGQHVSSPDSVAQTETSDQGQ